MTTTDEYASSVAKAMHDAGARVYMSGGDWRIEANEAQLQTAVAELVAAVKEHEGEWRRQAIRHAKAIVRRDIARAIRADTDGAEWALSPQEHAARIAEGNTDRA